MKTETSYNLSEFVSDVLKQSFPDNRFKQHVNEDEDKLNFACPYCGDSENDVSKKRGNIFLKTGTYKCFNDGCLTFTKIPNFVSHWARKHHLPIPSMIHVEPDRKIQHGTKRGELIMFLMDPKVKGVLINFKELADRFFLKKCSEAPLDSPIGEYITGRNIRELPAFDKSCYYDSRQDKIYIFNLDLRSGRVLGLSIRRINDDYSGPKYDIKNYSQFVKNKLIDAIDEAIITKIDIVNSYFNILNINFNEPIIVLEGQIDAMFLKNSIATTGVTKGKNILGTLVSKKNGRILFDNDSAGKKETFKLLQDGYSVFLWSKLIKQLRDQYPNNRKDVNGIKDINNLYNFYDKMGDRKTYDEFNEIIMSNFSESPFDLLFV